MAEPEESTGRLSTLRVVTLADGIFAIAMTLLVFEVKVPIGATSDGDLWSRLVDLWPRFASCGLAFLTLGFAWIGHHNQYLAIRSTDRTFLWLNVAFLSAIAVVPFSSALLGEYPLRLPAVMTYAGNLAVAGALLYAHWSYATTNHRLVDPAISADFIRGTKRRVLTAPLAYVGAITLAAVSVRLGLLVCLLVPLYFMLPGRVDRHWTAKTKSATR